MQVLIVKYPRPIRGDEIRRKIKEDIKKQIVEENFLLLDSGYEYEVVEIDNLIVKEKENDKC